MTMNLNGGAVGGNYAAGNATLTGLSGGATTFSTTAANGLTSLPLLNNGVFQTLANQAGAATPTFNAASAGAVAGTAASGSAISPLVAQQAPAGISPNVAYTGSAAAFVWGVDNTGLVRVCQGKVVNYQGSAISCPLPEIPDWFTPFAYHTVKLVSATPATWTFGTGNWNATGVTIGTVSNCSFLPATDPIQA